jgi:hypothetical protein
MIAAAALVTSRCDIRIIILTTIFYSLAQFAMQNTKQQRLCSWSCALCSSQWQCSGQWQR